MEDFYLKTLLRATLIYLKIIEHSLSWFFTTQTGIPPLSILVRFQRTRISFYFFKIKSPFRLSINHYSITTK